MSLRNNSTARNNDPPRNTDRAEWAALAVAKFVGATATGDDLRADPETVLVDLLTDLMHWCDAQKPRPGPEKTINFESALERARSHYQEEVGNRRRRSPSSPSDRRIRKDD